MCTESSVRRECVFSECVLQGVHRVCSVRPECAPTAVKLFLWRIHLLLLPLLSDDESSNSRWWCSSFISLMIIRFCFFNLCPFYLLFSRHPNGNCDHNFAPKVMANHLSLIQCGIRLTILGIRVNLHQIWFRSKAHTKSLFPFHSVYYIIKEKWTLFLIIGIAAQHKL